MKYLILILLLLVAGCSHTKTIYVPESQKIEYIKWNNIDGYFIPKSKMQEITEVYIKYKYYLKKYGPIDEN